MIKLICETDPSHVEYTAIKNIEISIASEATLDEMLEAYTNFLRVCGYTINYDQVLDFVEMDKNDNS